MAFNKVEIWQMMKDNDGHDVIFLRDDRGKILSISIGTCEAAAIWIKLSPDFATSIVRRPWSHDLIVSFLQKMGATISRIEIDNVVDTTFYSTIRIIHNNKYIIADARPSDAIAIALRVGADIYVDDSIMDETGFFPGENNI